MFLGHVGGLLIPESWTKALGITETMYHAAAASLGIVLGLGTSVLGNLTGHPHDYRQTVSPWFRWSLRPARPLHETAAPSARRPDHGLMQLQAVSVVILTGLLISTATGASSTPIGHRQPAMTAVPVLAAAGDIACSPSDRSFNGGAGDAKRCHERATSDLVIANSPTAVAALGDNQYDDATASEFAGSYNPTWGRFKTITRPTPGNHEYQTPGASGYYTYFGSLAGNPSTGYYSYDLGAWHIVVLNANCGQAKGCGAGSTQERWLQADLAAHPVACTLAYWHQPRFSSARQGGNTAYSAFWQDLYDAHAEIVLNGHHHHYERFATMNPSGAADAAGVREFIVGTGGENVQGFATPEPASQVRLRAFGVLFLTLADGSYSWRFASDAGGSTLDSGSASCH